MDQVIVKKKTHPETKTGWVYSTNYKKNYGLTNWYNPIGGIELP